MRHDEPANMMHLVKPLLLLIGVLVLLLIVDTAWGDGVRVYEVAGSDGPDITLAQVAEIDGDYANAYADVLVGRFEKDQAKLDLKTAAILEALMRKGARLGMIDVSGFGQCVVHRTFEAAQVQALEEQAQQGDQAVANIDARGNGALTIHTPTTVRSVIEHQIAKETGIALGSLEVEFMERDESLIKASAVAGRFAVQPTTTVTLGKVSFRVQAFEGTRKKGEASVVTATVRQRVLAVIATDMIKRNAMITRRGVRLSEVLIDDVAQPYLQQTSLVTGQIASMTIKPGELITSGKVAMPLAVKRRSSVAVQYESGGIKITFNGIALEEGAVDDQVQVENTLTKERFTATVVGRGKVVAGDTNQTEKQGAKQ